MVLIVLLSVTGYSTILFVGALTRSRHLVVDLPVLFNYILQWS